MSTTTPRLGLNKPDIGSTNWGTDVNDNWDTLDGAGDYILIRDVKSSGTDGGTFTSGAWRTRDLTEETVDVGNHASLSSNQITLEAGTYRYRIYCPAYKVNGHTARLYNNSDSAIMNDGEGAATYASEAYKGHTHSYITGRFTITQQKTLEIQHRCNTTHSGNGFGFNTSLQDEVYTIAEFWFEV